MLFHPSIQIISFVSRSYQKYQIEIAKIWKSLRLNKCKCSRSEDGEDEEHQQIKEASADEEKKAENNGADIPVVEGVDENSLTRTPCHDSGIDIRDSLPSVPIIPTKKVNLFKSLDNSCILPRWLSFCRFIAMQILCWALTGCRQSQLHPLQYQPIHVHKPRHSVKTRCLHTVQMDARKRQVSVLVSMTSKPKHPALRREPVKSKRIK